MKNNQLIGLENEEKNDTGVKLVATLTKKIKKQKKLSKQKKQSNQKKKKSNQKKQYKRRATGKSSNKKPQKKTKTAIKKK